MVTIGLYGLLLMPVALYLMDDDDHIGFANGRIVVDPVGQESLRVVVLVGLGTLTVGWLLWIIAAALNARGKSRWSISPFSLPMTYFCVGGLVIAASAFTENFTNRYTNRAIIVVVCIAVICHLGVLAAFRRAAVAIGAPDTPWTYVMVLPLAIAGNVAVGSFFTKAISSQTISLAFSVFSYLLALLAVASWVRAMASFDRASVGRQMTHENMEIPAFLRGG
ncbi:hypothetical protein BH10ACT2_BH10ACT2_17880 [soil metagenome]